MAYVLIVDDDESDRMLMRSLLGNEGHELYLASNGEQAMRLYLRHPIDVVVTDIQMDRGDGIELISIEFQLIVFRHQDIDVGQSIVSVACFEFFADKVEIGQV